MYSTIVQIAGAVINIILDSIMIYGWFGCPQMGVKGAAYATVIGQIASAVGFVGLELFAVPLAGIFGLSGETKELCISAMRIISISYVLAGANIAFQGIFQALDSGMESLIISVCRQFLIVIPVAYGFSKVVIAGTSGIWLVWLTFFIAELLSVAISLAFMKRIHRTKIMAIHG